MTLNKSLIKSQVAKHLIAHFPKMGSMRSTLRDFWNPSVFNNCFLKFEPLLDTCSERITETGYGNYLLGAIVLSLLPLLPFS
jgi:hypothetical protein